MAATHTYVITAVSVLGDQLTVVGTVDGISVTVNTWVSAAGTAMATAVGFQNFIQPLMLAAVPPQPTQHPELTQTFTV